MTIPESIIAFIVGVVMVAFALRVRNEPDGRGSAMVFSFMGIICMVMGIWWWL